MKKYLSDKTAGTVLVIVFAALMVFHFLILTSAIPYGSVWGGRLKSHSEMVTFESVSLVVNGLMLGIAAVKAGYLKMGVHPTLIRVSFWVMAVLFLLNTLGNLLSTSPFEKIVFTPVTLLLSLISFRLARS